MKNFGTENCRRVCNHQSALAPFAEMPYTLGSQKQCSRIYREVADMDYRNGKCARRILDGRSQEGMWGNFDTLSILTGKKPITTEQAIHEDGQRDFGSDA